MATVTSITAREQVRLDGDLAALPELLAAAVGRALVAVGAGEAGSDAGVVVRQAFTSGEQVAYDVEATVNRPLR